MDEYIGVYDEPYLQTHIIRIKAFSYEDAEDMFREYLEDNARLYSSTDGVMVILHGDLHVLK